MKQKENLTNETLKGICKSNFELARYAILLGRHYIKAGQEVEMSDLLDEIKVHPDPIYLEEIAQEEAAGTKAEES
jgi:hypothetical protein